MVTKFFMSSNASNKLRLKSLVGTMDRWNNGKRAEERDRVKHGLDDPTGGVY